MVTHIALLDESYRVCLDIIDVSGSVTVLGKYPTSSSLNLLSAVVGHVDPVAHPDIAGSRVVHPSVRVGRLGRLAGLRRLAGSRTRVARVRRTSVGRLGTSVVVGLSVVVILGRRGRLCRLVVDIDVLVGVSGLLLCLVARVRVLGDVAVELVEDASACIALQGLVTLLDGVLGLVDDVCEHVIGDLVGWNLRHRAVDGGCGLRVGVDGDVDGSARVVDIEGGTVGVDGADEAHGVVALGEFDRGSALVAIGIGGHRVVEVHIVALDMGDGGCGVLVPTVVGSDVEGHIDGSWLLLFWLLLGRCERPTCHGYRNNDRNNDRSGYRCGLGLTRARPLG